MRRLLLVALVLLVAVPAAGAAQPQFTMSEIEAELMCPTCQTRLDLSHSPAADRIRAYVEAKREAGWTKQQVKDALVADFGPAVLAAPPARGFGLVAWLAPIAIGVIGIAVALALIRRRRRPALAPVDTALEARVDAALREHDDY
jgi:cytochrome c-type biogenesis protein CcmH